MILLLTVAGFFLVANLVLAWMSIGMAVGALTSGGTVISVDLGIGPRLFRYRHFGTTYRIRVVPLGVIIGVDDIPPARRKLFAASAGLWGIATALALCYLQAGPLGDATMFQSPRIGYVQPGSDAARAGLLPGDVLRAIDGHPVDRWREAVVRLKARGEPGTARIEFTRGNEAVERELKFERVDNRVFGEFAVFGLFPPTPSTIRNVARGSAAWQAGIRRGDAFRRIGQRDITHFVEAYDVLSASPDAMLDVEIERGGARHVFRLDRTQETRTPPFAGSVAGIDFAIAARSGGVALPFMERITAGPRLLRDKLWLSVQALRERRLKRDLSVWFPLFFLGTVSDKLEALALFLLFLGTLNLLNPFPPAAMAQFWWGHTGLWGPRLANGLGVAFIVAVVVVPF